VIRHAASIMLLLALPACASGDRGLEVAYHERVAVEGTSLFLEVRGARADAPVLLWLHGGPGGSERPLFRLFNADLEQSFRVAYLDQRGAGLSGVGSSDSPRLTVEQHLRDLDRVVQYLRNREGTHRLILVGHSWGSLLGALYVAKHPHKVFAFVGMSQVVAPLEDQKEEFRFALSRAADAGDRRALDELARIGRPPLDGAAELRLDRLVDGFGGSSYRPRKSFRTVLGAVSRGLVSPLSIPRFIAANQRSVIAMTPELLAIDLRRSVTALDVPVILFLGRHDRQISTDAAKAWLARLRAPDKALVTFESSAHNISFEEPAAFRACLLSVLHPPNRPGKAACPYPIVHLRRSTAVGRARSGEPRSSNGRPLQ
jgi:pimeloyl-ACP methyl ester carboxylesterase